MAKIIIRKGFYSQNGKLYKAGDVVAIQNAASAKRLVARSGGDFDFYHEPIVSETEEDAAAAEPEGEETGAVSDSDTESGTDDGLPAINAAEAVKTFGGKGGRATT